MADEKTPVQAPPPGCVPLMISSKQMESYELKTGSGLRDTVPYKLVKKEDALEEIQRLGFYSPFHPFRKELDKYPLEDILIVADPDEVYGENWILALTEAAFNTKMEEIDAAARAEAEAKRKAEEAEMAARRAREELENKVYEDLPLTPRPYVSATAPDTEAEVARLTVRPSRPLAKMRITRKRRHFGGRYVFSDKDADGAAAEFRGRRAPEYTLTRSEKDVALQDCAGSISRHDVASTQTTWNRQINTAVQCKPEAVVPASSDSAAGNSLLEFFGRVMQLCEYALEQNETLDIFQDELALLDEDDVMVVGTKGENAVRTLINFMDLTYSNNKALVTLDWHPSNRAWVATSAVTELAFDARVANSGRATLSYVLVYTFAEFSAQIVLESPQDIMCFRWNPYHPAQIAAGCATGQVLLYDLTDAMDELNRNKRKGGKSSSGKKKASGEGDSESKSDKSICVKYSYMSTIDHSHSRSVADLHWLPPSHQLSTRLKFEPDEDDVSYQFVSAASDGQVLVWDTRVAERGGGRRRGSTGGGATAAGGTGGQGSSAPAAEVPWMPIYKCTLRGGGQGKCGVCRFTINNESPTDPMCCTTEDGHFVIADWVPPGQGTGYEKMGVADAASASVDDTAEGAEGAPSDAGQFRVLWTGTDHHRPTLALERSPFFDDLLLSVGCWGFTLWRNGMQQPLFRSPSTGVPVTCGRWSPTRPSVVFIGKSDGTIDIWDLVDQTHKPSLVKPVVSLPITCMEFRSPALAKTQQFLGVGDANGNLHILDIPVSLRKAAPSDHSLMQSWLEREFARVEYFNARATVRAEELVQKEAAAEAAERQEQAAAAAREAEITAAMSSLAEGEELDLDKLAQMKVAKAEAEEEARYQALERAIMTDLGLDPDTYVVPDDSRSDDGEEETKTAGAGAGAGAGLGATGKSLDFTTGSMAEPDDVVLELASSRRASETATKAQAVA